MADSIKKELLILPEGAPAIRRRGVWSLTRAQNPRSAGSIPAASPSFVSRRVFICYGYGTAAYMGCREGAKERFFLHNFSAAYRLCVGGAAPPHPRVVTKYQRLRQAAGMLITNLLIVFFLLDFTYIDRNK